jgi:hypothetical protein
LLLTCICNIGGVSKVLSQLRAFGSAHGLLEKAIFSYFAVSKIIVKQYKDIIRHYYDFTKALQKPFFTVNNFLKNIF